MTPRRKLCINTRPVNSMSIATEMAGKFSQSTVICSSLNSVKGVNMRLEPGMYYDLIP